MHDINEISLRRPLKLRTALIVLTIFTSQRHSSATTLINELTFAEKQSHVQYDNRNLTLTLSDKQSTLHLFEFGESQSGINPAGTYIKISAMARLGGAGALVCSRYPRIRRSLGIGSHHDLRTRLVTDILMKTAGIRLAAHAVISLAAT